MDSSCIQLSKDGIRINGQPLILLTSSLFYFRIPAFEWRNRMRTLRLLGYNAIDVYFPWNYHELSPGQWDFSGERDVRTFLQLAKDEDLWVIARPGPYICSEWDGGSLPSYLNNHPDLKLRDNNPLYLQAVQSWYDRILPVLSEFQIGRNGSVVLVQIENELDFYNCADPHGLMTALRDMALAHHIRVPLIACAGEGDLPGATGSADGVVPACNVYFDTQDPEVEARVRHYARVLADQGFPLCITETNRSHTDLRRLLAGGAKLLGPYLQTGGTDFGFTTGITNWGEPLAFMTSHYDFGGMVTPGGKVRSDGREALIFSKMLQALGPSVALSAPLDYSPVLVHGADGHALALNGGGWLVGIPNPGHESVQVCLGEAPSTFPVKTRLIIAPNTCPFMLLEYPLSSWDIDGHISYATVELVKCSKNEGQLELVFAVDDSAEVVLQWTDAALSACRGWQVETLQAGWRLWLDTNSVAEAEFSDSNDKKLLVKAIRRVDVGSLEKAGINPSQIVSVKPVSGIDVNWRLESVNPCSADWFKAARPCKSNELYLEQNQIYRGFGWYRSSFSQASGMQGFLIRSGADVLSCYLNGQFLGTLVPGGGDAYVEVPKSGQSVDASELIVRAEIWGHSNFDDHRLPALRLKSMRGIGGAAAVHRTDNQSANWFYQHREQVPVKKIDSTWPMLSFGGWSTTDEPARGIYYRQMALLVDTDTRVLHFPGLQVNAKVFVNGQLADSINPFNPFVDISTVSMPGEIVQIAIAVEQPFRRPAGQVLLYQGQSLPSWHLAGWDETKFLESAKDYSHAGQAIHFPVTLVRGEMAWLHADMPISLDWESGWGLQMVGQGLKISAWVGGYLVGRIWLPAEMRPRMAGGLDDRLVLPDVWLREAGGKIHLLLESVCNQSTAELHEIKLIQDI